MRWCLSIIPILRNIRLEQEQTKLIRLAALRGSDYPEGINSIGARVLVDHPHITAGFAFNHIGFQAG